MWRLPFNWRTPLGYLVALFAQFTGSFAVLFSALTVFSFLVGSCWLFYTISRDINQDLKCLKCKKSSDGNDRSLKIHFYHIVQVYLDAKQLSSYSKKIDWIDWFYRHTPSPKIENRFSILIFSNHNLLYMVITLIMWKKGKNVFILCRLTDDFNEIHGTLFTTSFLWSRLAICSSLLVVHLQLVFSYPINSIGNLPISPFFTLSVWTCTESEWHHFQYIYGILGICCCPRALYPRWNCVQPIWYVLWRTL